MNFSIAHARWQLPRLAHKPDRYAEAWQPAAKKGGQARGQSLKRPIRQSAGAHCARPRGERRLRGGSGLAPLHTSHLILLFLAETGAHRTATDLEWTPWLEDATTMHALLFLDLLEEEAATLLAHSCCKSHRAGSRRQGCVPCGAPALGQRTRVTPAGGWAINRTRSD